MQQESISMYYLRVIHVCASKEQQIKLFTELPSSKFATNVSYFVFLCTDEKRMNTIACKKCGQQTTNAWVFCDTCPSLAGVVAAVFPNYLLNRRFFLESWRQKMLRLKSFWSGLLSSRIIGWISSLVLQKGSDKIRLNWSTSGKVRPIYGANMCRILTLHGINLFFRYQLLPLYKEDLVRKTDMAARLSMLFIEEAARNKTFRRTALFEIYQRANFIFCTTQTRRRHPWRSLKTSRPWHSSSTVNSMVFQLREEEWICRQ